MRIAVLGDLAIRHDGPDEVRNAVLTSSLTPDRSLHGEFFEPHPSHRDSAMSSRGSRRSEMTAPGNTTDAAAPAHTYWQVLTTRNVAKLLVAASLSRLASSMLLFVVVLYVI